MQAELWRVQRRLEDSHWWYVGRRHIVHSVVRTLLPPRSRRTLLDVGAGSGGVLRPLAAEYQLRAVDTEPQAVEAGRQQVPAATWRLVSTVADYADLVEEADGVLLLDVLEHVVDPRALLRELAAAMRPGAWILVSVPSASVPWSPHDVAWGHRRRYTGGRLLAELGGLPLAVRLLTPWNAALCVPIQLVRTWTRWSGRGLGDGGSDLATTPAVLNRVLTRILSAEAVPVVAALGSGIAAFRDGASLLLVAQRLG